MALVGVSLWLEKARTLQSNLSRVSYSNVYPFPMARFVALLWCLSLAHTEPDEPACTGEHPNLVENLLVMNPSPNGSADNKNPQKTFPGSLPPQIRT